MYFCPKCSYILDIGKSSKITNQEDTVITKVNDLFALIEGKKDLNKYKIEIQKEEIVNSKKYQKIQPIYKTMIDNIFDINVLSTAEFKCNNCNYTNQIIKTTLLYNIIINDNNTDNILSYDECVLMTQDPLLPHTSDYVCMNDTCKTKTNNKLKNAIFYKKNKTYNVSYICTVCYCTWDE